MYHYYPSDGPEKTEIKTQNANDLTEIPFITKQTVLFNDFTSRVNLSGRSRRTAIASKIDNNNILLGPAILPSSSPPPFDNTRPERAVIYLFTRTSGVYVTKRGV